MRTSIKMKLRRSITSDKPGSIYFQIIHLRKVMAITTPYRVYHYEWNADKGSLLIDTSDVNRSRYLEKVYQRLNEEVVTLKSMISDLENNYPNYEASDVISLYKQKDVTLSQYVKKLNMELKSREQFRLKRAYQSVANKFIAFNKGKDLKLKELTPLLVKDFEDYMKTNENTKNTISFYMRNLRSIYNKAVREKLIFGEMRNLFSDVFTGVAKTEKRAVREDIIEALRTYSFKQKDEWQYAFARDMFYLSFCLRGISFIDLAFLKKDAVQNNILIYIRHKTRQKLEIGLTPEIIEIIDRYASYCKDSPYLVPIIRNDSGIPDRLLYENALRNQNNRLKKISEMLNLSKPITTYVARHSWATLARKRGIPLSLISQGLGHESEKTTRIYLDSFNMEILDWVNKEVITYARKIS